MPIYYVGNFKIQVKDQKGFLFFYLQPMWLFSALFLRNINWKQMQMYKTEEVFFFLWQNQGIPLQLFIIQKLRGGLCSP